MNKFRSILAVGLLLSAASTVPAGAETLKVVASFSIIADFARQVGGDRLSLTTLVGPNGDVHVYEPRPADIAALSEADLFLANGLHFEGFLTRAADASGGEVRTVALSDGIEPLREEEQTTEGHDDHAGEATGHDHGAVDPHAFQSVANAKTYVGNIATAFCSADQAGCAIYRANADAYILELDQLDMELKSAATAIPLDKRIVITSHDAFGYFGRAYGLTFLAPEGVSTDAEASAADVAALVRQVRENNASAIFVENISNPGLIEQIAAETGVRVGGTLYSDALSDGNGPASTYLDLMRYNMATIKGAILGS